MARDRFARHLSHALILESRGVSWRLRLLVAMGVVGSSLFLVGLALIRVDEAVTARGSFVPRSAVHLIQTPEEGIVTRLPVREGRAVAAGEVLIRLDNAVTVAQREQMVARRAVLLARSTRLEAFLAGEPADFSPVGPGFPDVVREQEALLAAQNLARASSLAVIDTQLVQKRAAIQEVEEELASARERHEVNTTLLRMRQELGKKQLASRMSQLEARRTHLTTAGEVAGLERELEVRRHALEEVEGQRRALEGELRVAASEELGQVRIELAQVGEMLARLESRKGHLEIRSPVAGRVQDLRLRSLGGVARVGDTLMRIVPSDEELTLEIHVPSQDIAFVRPGQEVVIKVESYDFQRYGTVEGRLTALSPFTRLDQGQSAYYKGIVEPAGRWVGPTEGGNPILPGMRAEADIILGARSLLIYLVKPLLAANDTRAWSGSF